MPEFICVAEDSENQTPLGAVCAPSPRNGQQEAPVGRGWLPVLRGPPRPAFPFSWGPGWEADLQGGPLPCALVSRWMTDGRGPGKAGVLERGWGFILPLCHPTPATAPPTPKYTTPSFQHLGEGVLWADISPPELTSYPPSTVFGERVFKEVIKIKSGH